MHSFEVHDTTSTEDYKLLRASVSAPGRAFSTGPTTRQKQIFLCLAALIASDPIFDNRSSNKQRPVVTHLVVMLECLGTYGNGASVGRLARSYGIGAGIVVLYMKRIVQALLKHYGHYIRWPRRHEREVSSAYHIERFGIDGAIRFVDGTQFSFSQKPNVDRETRGLVGTSLREYRVSCPHKIQSKYIIALSKST